MNTTNETHVTAHRAMLRALAATERQHAANALRRLRDATGARDTKRERDDTLAIKRMRRALTRARKLEAQARAFE